MTRWEDTVGYMLLLRGEHMERRRAREPVWDGWLACSASTATLDARFATEYWHLYDGRKPVHIVRLTCALDGTG